MSDTIITIRMTVVAGFLLATTITASLALGLQYYFGRDMASEAASDLYTGASESVAAKWQHISEQNANIITLLSENPELANDSIEGERLHSLAALMERNPLFYGIYLGHEDGSFHELINLNTGDEARRKLNAVPTDRWLVIDVDGAGNGRSRTYRYFNANFELRVERSEYTGFDPRERLWYTQALESEGPYRSAPYLFAQLNQPGRTISIPIAGSRSVLGFDMTLETLSDFLREQTVADSGSLFVFDTNGSVLASSESRKTSRNAPPIKFYLTQEEREYVDSLGQITVSNELDWPPFDYALQGRPEGYSVDVMKLVAEAANLDFRFVNGFSWAELTEQFKNGELDLLHSVILTDSNRDWGVATIPFVELPFAIASRADAPPIESLSALNGRRLAIPAGWSVIPVVRRAYPEIEIVESASTLAAMKAVLANEVDAALDNQAILEYVARNFYIEGLTLQGDLNFGGYAPPDSFHILAQEGFEPLVAILDRAIAAIGPEQRSALYDHWLSPDSEGAAADPATVPSDIYLSAAKDGSLQNRLLSIDLQGEPHFAYAAPLAQDQEAPLMLGLLVPERSVVGPFMEKVLLSIAITAGALLLLVPPLSWMFANPIVKPIRQLATENEKVRRREYDAVEYVPSRVREIHELSDSMVSMVAAIKAHEIAQRELMDAFIRLIAAAIDEKSPYTGGHCERVPELALMLAKHASDSNAGPFEQFQLDTEDQWREYRIAAWLHDCGKITTPEHIVDKGSKLETIYNRLHEVRMRFEVLWRDAEIHYLRSLQENAADEGSLLQQLERERERLQDEYAFIADCNVGGEYLDPEKQERLREIAARSWTRYFDDRIGLSPVEELRAADHPPVPTPAEEPLLSDKPEHIIERTRSTDYPQEYGIDMDIPDHLYNQGELYNLSISRGTLTAEDRFKINEHMISTIKMLESLPFPDELKNVPRWASTHHETMRGSGYPRKLPGSELSIPERIMAVADVFEALTAADRPYKKAKPVSVAIDILHKMVEDEHIDRDCFELFVRNRVYIEYAERYLDPSQIDEVDASRYVSAA